MIQDAPHFKIQERPTMTNKSEHILANLASDDDIAALMLTVYHDIHDHLELNNLVDMWCHRTALISENIYSQEKYFNIDLSGYVPEIIDTVTEFDRIRLSWAVDRHRGFPNGVWYAFEQWPTPQLQLPTFTTNTSENRNISLDLEFCPVCGTCNQPYHLLFNYDHDHNTGLIRGYICRECNVYEGRSYTPAPSYRELTIPHRTASDIDNFWVPWRTGHDHYMSQNIYKFYDRVTRTKSCSVGGRIHNTLLSRLRGDALHFTSEHYAQTDALFKRILPRLRLDEGKLTEFDENSQYGSRLASMFADDPSYISRQEILDLIDTAMTSLTNRACD